MLDPARIERIQQDTREVSALLTDLFTDPDRDPDPDLAVTTNATCNAAVLTPDRRFGTNGSWKPGWPKPAGDAGLAEPGHPQAAGLVPLLRLLQGRQGIATAEWAGMCAAQGLLPAAAVNALNERALELVDDLLCHGTNPVLIDLDVLQEML